MEPGNKVFPELRTEFKWLHPKHVRTAKLRSACVLKGKLLHADSQDGSDWVNAQADRWAHWSVCRLCGGAAGIARFAVTWIILYSRAIE